MFPIKKQRDLTLSNAKPNHRSADLRNKAISKMNIKTYSSYPGLKEFTVIKMGSPKMSKI